VTIRPAETRDLDAIAAIQERSSWTPEDYLKVDCRVVEDDNVVLGFLASREIAPAEREILFIAVDNQHRRRGMARRLLEDELARARGEWFLEVRESNVAARLLYEALGFRIAGKRQYYYSDPSEAAIVMRFFS
jgi:ribosomal-protein-alanine N-acetyltransferase